MIPVNLHVEKATAFDKGKGIKTRKIITIKEVLFLRVIFVDVIQHLLSWDIPLPPPPPPPLSRPHPHPSRCHRSLHSLFFIYKFMTLTLQTLSSRDSQCKLQLMKIQTSFVIQHILVAFQDIPNKDIDFALTSCDKEPPHLLVLKADGILKGSFVIGDGVHIRCKETVTYAVVTLLAVYYVFDLEYPI